jgi:hypothetical protein
METMVTDEAVTCQDSFYRNFVAGLIYLSGEGQEVPEEPLPCRIYRASVMKLKR